jgi:hypothetical protein
MSNRAAELEGAALGQHRPIFAPARSRSQGPLSDQVADAPNPRGQCRTEMNYMLDQIAFFSSPVSFLGPLRAAWSWLKQTT